MALEDLAPFTPEFATHLRSEDYFYERHIEHELDLVASLVLATEMIKNGFRHDMDVPYPVVPSTDDSFVPEGSPGIEERLRLARQRMHSLFMLQDTYGKDNVWLGPAIENPFEGLSPAEHRGLWVNVPIL